MTYSYIGLFLAKLNQIIKIMRYSKQLQEILNKEYYLSQLNEPIDLSFECIATDIGDRLSVLEQMYIDAAKIEREAYDPRFMDRLADEIDLLLNTSKQKIKAGLEKSVVAYLKKFP
ncbi:MAG: hypothetical protein Tsb006_6820 [Rickettsiaceae bacterium]